jgi:membrane-associated phospholipid phosphatase
LDPNFRSLLTRSLVALAAGLCGVVFCYYWVDRPVAFFVHGHGWNEFRVFKWLTYPPPCVQTWSPLVLTLLMFRRAFGPLAVCKRTLLAALLSLILADVFRVSLGDLCGRYWPETWFGNPSLIGTGTYGFHAFQWGDDIGSFPSGHATRILSFSTVWWLAVPRSRPLWLLVCPPMLFSLVAMDYHFVGDVVAGVVLGGIVGAYTVRLGLAETASACVADGRPAVG